MPPMQYSLRSLVLVVALAAALGCGPYRPSKVKTVLDGIDSVDKHAKEIEKANQPIGKERPTP